MCTVLLQGIPVTDAVQCCHTVCNCNNKETRSDLFPSHVDSQMGVAVYKHWLRRRTKISDTR